MVKLYNLQTEKQQELCLSSLDKSTKDFALTVAIGEVFAENVSVASFDFSQKLAFSLRLCPE